MEVVRKDYNQLHQQEYIKQEKQKPEPNKKKKAKKNYRLEKVMATLGIMSVLILGISLLLRYASITELRHQVHRLDKQLEQMENQKEKLKIEMEKVSKSKSIEEAARERLNMQYPGKEDVFYVAIDPTKVSLINNEINKQINKVEEIQLSSNSNPFSKMLHKITGFLNI